jgi:hypothetical protein
MGDISACRFAGVAERELMIQRQSVLNAEHFKTTVSKGNGWFWRWQCLLQALLSELEYPPTRTTNDALKKLQQLKKKRTLSWPRIAKLCRKDGWRFGCHPGGLATIFGST